PRASMAAAVAATRTCTRSESSIGNTRGRDREVPPSSFACRERWSVLVDDLDAGGVLGCGRHGPGDLVRRSRRGDVGKTRPVERRDLPHHLVLPLALRLDDQRVALLELITLQARDDRDELVLVSHQHEVLPGRGGGAQHLDARVTELGTLPIEKARGVVLTERELRG